MQVSSRTFAVSARYIIQRTHAERLCVEYLVPAEGRAEQAVDFSGAGAVGRAPKMVPALVQGEAGSLWPDLNIEIVKKLVP